MCHIRFGHLFTSIAMLFAEENSTKSTDKDGSSPTENSQPAMEVTAPEQVVVNITRVTLTGQTTDSSTTSSPAAAIAESAQKTAAAIGK